MGVSRFQHVRIAGMKTVIPERCIDIDDELHYFDDNPKKLARQKKMIGYGRRYISDESTTVVDLACDAARRLMVEMSLTREDVDMLLFVNQKPDYPEPCDANLAHGRLGLLKSTSAMHINLGCSGYVYALLTAHALIESGAVKRILLLAGDLCGRMTDQTNRKAAPVFGDAASATYLVWDESERKSTFVMGADGSGWDKIIHPFGGTRIPYAPDICGREFEDVLGNPVRVDQGVMKGEDVFKFTMEVAPQLIKDVLAEAGWTNDEVDLFSVHQANKQILEMIVSNAGIPMEKTPIDVFSKYANNSTNSVVTVLCDQPGERKLGKVVMAAFGIGLSWGGAALDLEGFHNGGIETYHAPEGQMSREEQIEYWRKFFKGEE